MKKSYEVSEKEIMTKTQVLMSIMGNNLKIKRISKGLSRTDLAFYANTTESMICKIENSKKSGISIYTLIKLSIALDIDICDLFLLTS